MAHDVFVSYSSKDKPVADAVVAGIEGKGIRCWIAPRDVMPGTSWGEAIVDAIEASRVMVVILSGNSNQSRQVVREVERAVASGVVIIPFRIENIDPTGAMAYFLSTEHWLDALTPPLERHIEKLGTTIQLFLSGEDASVLGQQLTEPEPDASPALRRWWPMPALPAVLSVIAVAALAVVFLPQLIGQKPATPPPSPTVAATPTNTLPPPTPTPTPTPSFSVIGNWPTSREAHSVFVHGDTAYVANGADGLVIVDVTDPSQPQEIGSYALEEARNVVVSADVAYITAQGQVTGGTAGNDKLVVIDVSLPSTPRLLGEYSPESGFVHRTLNHLAVDGETVYLTTSDRLILIDVSTPSEPVTVGEFGFSSNISSPGISVEDGIVYLQANRFHVVDARNPGEPVEIGGSDLGWGAGIDVVGDIAYVAGWDGGLSILDVSTPSRPVRLGRYMELVGDHELVPPGATTRQLMLDVSVSDDVAYVSYSFGLDQGTWTQTLEAGVIAVDVSDPTDPRRLTIYSELDGISSVCAMGDLIFATDPSQGLAVLSLERSE